MHKSYIFYISLIFYSNIISVPVIERYTINSIQDIEQFITPETLAVFDIDDTLLHDMSHGAMTLVESDTTSSTFKRIKNKAWNTLAITARSKNYDYQLFTLNQLDHYDITFTPFFDDTENETSCILLNNKNKTFHNKGVIFVEGTNKGNALHAFLKQLPHVPEKVVFMDDTSSNLDHVINVFKNNNDFPNLKTIILCDYPYVKNH